MRALFITGWGRSGSTLLDSLLGQTAGLHSGGEIRYVWDRGLLENRACSCGATFHQCELWRRVARPFLSLPASDLHRLVDSRDRLRVRHCWSRERLAARLRDGGLLEYARSLRSLYERLFAETGAQIVVDSSKFPSHGVFLERAGIELTILHLIRDPRAVAYSWSRQKVYDRDTRGPLEIRRRSSWKSTLYWATWNRVIETLWAGSEADGRYLRLRYEDFIASPSETLRKVLDALGVDSDYSYFIDDSTVWLEPSHLPSGNPGRFSSGKVELALDDEWRRNMRIGARMLVTFIGFSLMHRYGYSSRDRS